MQKRKLCWLCGTATLAAVAVLAALTLAVKYEPGFYRQDAGSLNTTHHAMKAALVVGFGQMFLDIQDRREGWGSRTSESHINCFFQKEFDGLPEAASLRKLGISAPRVALDDDRVRLAFRYGEGWFSTVISYHLKVWLVPKEENTIAVQVLSARAGALPISSQSVLQQLTEFASKQNCKVTLYRHEGTPVATVNLPPMPKNPYYLLTEFKFSTGKLSIQGITSENVYSGALPTNPPVIDGAK